VIKVSRFQSFKVKSEEQGQGHDLLASNLDTAKFEKSMVIGGTSFYAF
jgi:hypothetical protein